MEREKTEKRVKGDQTGRDNSLCVKKDDEEDAEDIGKRWGKDEKEESDEIKVNEKKN